jgi:hypothetical protein
MGKFGLVYGLSRKQISYNQPIFLYHIISSNAAYNFQVLIVSGPVKFNQLFFYRRETEDRYCFSSYEILLIFLTELHYCWQFSKNITEINKNSEYLQETSLKIIKSYISKDPQLAMSLYLCILGFLCPSSQGIIYKRGAKNKQTAIFKISKQK